MDLTALKTELTTDPAGLGYAAHLATGSFSPIVDLLAAARAGFTVFRGVLPSTATSACRSRKGVLIQGKTNNHERLEGLQQYQRGLPGGRWD